MGGLQPLTTWLMKGLQKGGKGDHQAREQEVERLTDSKEDDDMILFEG